MTQKRPASATAHQAWCSTSYDKHARFVSDLAGPVLQWLDAKPGERILDLGCGDGAITKLLAENGVDVLGIDASEDFVETARARGLDIMLGDGQALAFDGEFDAVFSNAALHWMTQADAVVSGVYRALKPGGRFVAEFGGHGNVAAIITAMRAISDQYNGDPALAGPWFFPSVEVYREMLETAGFTVERIELVPRPTPLKTGMAAWLKVFREPFFAQFGPLSGRIYNEVEDLLRPVLCDARGNWTADYIRLRVKAVKA